MPPERIESRGLRRPTRIGLLLAVAVLLWAGVLGVGLTTEPRFEDELFHLEFARTWFEQWPSRPTYQFNGERIIIGWFSAPGWHGCVAAISRAIGRFYWQTAQVFQSVLWIVAVAMAWLVGRTAMPDRPAAGPAAALVYATMPQVVLTGFVLFLEPLASIVTMAAAVLLLRRRYLVAAVAIGALWYAKLTAGAAVPALLATMAVAMLVDRNPHPPSPQRKFAGRLFWTVATLAVACLIVGVIVAPDLVWRDRVRRSVPLAQSAQGLRVDWLLRAHSAGAPGERADSLGGRPDWAGRRSPDPLVMRYPSDIRELRNWVIFPGVAVWLGLGLGLIALAGTCLGGRWRVLLDRRLLMLLAGCSVYVLIAVESTALGFRYMYPMIGAVSAAAGAGFAAFRRGSPIAMIRDGRPRSGRWRGWLLGAMAGAQFLGVLLYFSFVRERRVGESGRQAVAEIVRRAEPGEIVFSPDARIIRWYGHLPAFWSQTWSAGIDSSLGRLLALDRPEAVAAVLRRANVRFLFTSRERLQAAEGAFHDGFSEPWLRRLEQAGAIRRIVDNKRWLAWEVLAPGPTVEPEPTTRKAP